MKKKYSVLDDIVDTFFLFKNPGVTPVKAIVVCTFFVLVFILILVKF